MQIESELVAEAFDTVDERNHSPPEMYKISRKRDKLLTLAGSEDFFHQQYCPLRALICVPTFFKSQETMEADPLHSKTHFVLVRSC